MQNFKITYLEKQEQKETIAKSKGTKLLLSCGFVGVSKIALF
jgi:hypothetical protein